MIKKVIEYFKSLFMKKQKSSKITNTECSFHPEIQFMMNLPEAEYINYEET